MVHQLANNISPNIGIVNFFTQLVHIHINNHLYPHILEYIKYPNRAIQCTTLLTITITLNRIGDIISPCFTPLIREMKK